MPNLFTTVEASQVRKMVPDFVRGVKAVVNCVVIRDFPKDLTEAQLIKVIEHLNVSEEGRGTLRVTKCVKGEDGLYHVDAPQLIAAINRA